MTHRLVSRTALLFLILLAMTAVAFVDTETSAESIAGEYVWITRAADDPGHAECEAQNAGSECVELCMQLNADVFSMGKYCCLESWKIGGLDSPEECESWLH